MFEMCLNSWIISGLLVIILYIYWCLTRNLNHWSDRGINGPKPVGVLGNIRQNLFISGPLREKQWFNQFGRIYGHFQSIKPVLSVGEPELIKRILVTDFHLFTDRRRVGNTEHHILDKNLAQITGEDWKRIRSITSPTFSPSKMKNMYPMIRYCLNDFMDELQKCADIRQDIDCKEMFGNYSMDVIATCAFNIKINTNKDTTNQFVLNAKNVFRPILWRVIPAFLFPTCLLNILRIRSIFCEYSLNFFLKLAKHILKKRRNSKMKFNDFLQLLVDSEKDKEKYFDVKDVNEAHHLNEGEEELALEKKVLNIECEIKKLTEDEVLAQVMIFILAGFETTGATLTFATYELALNPEVQEKLYKEMINAFDSNGEIDYDLLAKLPYLDAVISETLRLHSPFLMLNRIVSMDCQLGDTGIHLPKGQIVDIPVYAIHTSNEFYTSPKKFIPHRFLPENRHLIKPYTYLPFGAGPRNCIGMRFALLETKLCLAHIVRRFRFLRSSKTEIPLTFTKLSGLNTPKNVTISIENRF